MSRQHSFISLVVVAWHSRSLLSKMIWTRQNRVQFRKTSLILRLDLRIRPKMSRSPICQIAKSAVQRSHLAGFGQEIHGVFRFQKSCDCETVEQCQITISVSLCLEQKSNYSSNTHFWETTEWESCNFQPHLGVTQQHFLKILSIKHAYLWFLDRDQLSYCFGLHVHLLESMFRVKELTVYFVWSEETWQGYNTNINKMHTKMFNFSADDCHSPWQTTKISADSFLDACGLVDCTLLKNCWKIQISGW